MDKKLKTTNDIDSAMTFLSSIDEEGPERVRKMREFSPEIADRIVAQLYGDIYQRPGLDLKMRALTSIVIVASTGMIAQLTYQLRFALLVGVDPSEVREALLHVGLFAGMARAINAEAILSQVEKHIKEKT